MPSSVVQHLKTLQHQRADDSPFPSHRDFMIWADEVAPLLDSHHEYKKLFTEAVANVERFNEKYGLDEPVRAINHSFGIMNQAVVAIELQESQPQDRIPLTWPEKFTLGWFIKHAPISIYPALGVLIAVSFGLGVTFSEMKTKLQSDNQNSPASKNTAPSSATPKLRRQVQTKSNPYLPPCDA